MMRWAVLLLGLGHGLATARNPQDDLKALDMASDEVTDNLPKNVAPAPKPKAKAPVKVKKVAQKVHKPAGKVVAVPKKQNVSHPVPESSKDSALWVHQKELNEQDEADQVLDEGDAEAHEKIEEMHEKKAELKAPAHVVRVPEAEIEAAEKDKTDPLESVKNVDQDIKDLKNFKIEEAKRKLEVEKEEKEEAEEKKTTAKKNHTATAKPSLPKKKINLDKLMNLAKAAKAVALKTQFVQQLDDSEPASKPTTVASKPTANASKPTTIASKAFKGPSMKKVVEKAHSNMHAVMAKNVADMKTALHETVKKEAEDQQYEYNKVKMAAKAEEEAKQVAIKAEAEKKKAEAVKYQQAMKVSQEKAKVEAEQRKVAKAKVADYREAQRKFREARASDEEKVLVKPQVAVQDEYPSRQSRSAALELGAFVTLAVVAAGL